MLFPVCWRVGRTTCYCSLARVWAVQKLRMCERLRWQAALRCGAARHASKMSSDIWKATVRLVRNACVRGFVPLRLHVSLSLARMLTCSPEAKCADHGGLSLAHQARAAVAQMWVLAAHFEVRQLRLDAARKILGMAIGMAPKARTEAQAPSKSRPEASMLSVRGWQHVMQVLV